MSSKLQFSGQTGLSAYALIRDREDDFIWNGSTFVTFSAASIEDYGIDLTANGHFYSVSFPSTITPGKYHVTYVAKIGASKDYSVDEVVFQALYDWDGSDLVDSSSTGTVSKTDICNMALGHLGVTSILSDVDTDDTTEAEVCRMYYDQARDATLRDFNWPFASQIADLGLVEEDPNDEWSYSYRYPSNCINFRRILSGTRNDTRQSRVPCKIGRDSSGLLIYTDIEDAQAEYTLRETDTGRYPVDFVNALSCRLAIYIAPGLTAGDPFKLGDRASKMYEYEIASAKSNSANEAQVEEDPDSEFIRERNS